MLRCENDVSEDDIEVEVEGERRRETEPANIEMTLTLTLTLTLSINCFSRERGKHNPQTLKHLNLALSSAFPQNLLCTVLGGKKDKEVEKYCHFLCLVYKLLSQNLFSVSRPGQRKSRGELLLFPCLYCFIVLYLQPSFIAVFLAIVLICPLYLDIWLTEEYSAISLRVNRVDIPSLSAFYITHSFNL